MPAFTRVDIAYTQPVDPWIDAFLTEIGLGFNPGDIRRRLRGDVMRLNAHSDAQLALFGIRRSEIPAYVLRRKFPEFA